MRTKFLVASLLYVCGISLLHAATYVGKDSCKSCHAEQVKQWQGSHHDLAMQHVSNDSVLGDFSNVTFIYAGITSNFYKNNNKFMVRTDGPDGKLHSYEIKYTFGVTPLQQYLIELEGGRLQALSIAWDTREKSTGGQRWFHLYPDEKITHTDELHWTRPSFNWNGMCAECHSTNLQKNYDSKTDTFKTSWSEINVSCEACHGPASNHISWTKTLIDRKLNASDRHAGFGFSLDERKNITWHLEKQSTTAQRSKKRETDKEIEVCAQCHSRRSAITENYEPGKPFKDHYMPRLLDEGMYFSDGQIQDEVYVYGSFLQSKMYHEGVTCSDCHEPHSLQLRQEGNGVCLQCHAAEKFDSKKHHFHEMGSSGAACAECHMPTRTYMGVDPRHDHSIRIPRPDFSVTLKTPNACNNCHKDNDASWAAEKVSQWYNKPTVGFQKYAHALSAARSSNVDAGQTLARVIRNIETADIARATAISNIGPYLDQSTVEVLQHGLSDKDAAVRMASVSALEGLPPEILAQLAFSVLDDSVRSVRIEAARVLAVVPTGNLKGEALKLYNRASKEYIHSQEVNAERPEAQLNLGNYYSVIGKTDKALNAYKKAIELDDMFVPAYINLADLYRVLGNDVKAGSTLRSAVRVSPNNATTHYALALSLIRQKKSPEALVEFKKAVEFDSSNVHYIYVYAVALNSSGKGEQAINVLQSANVRFPQNSNILEALVAFHRDGGNDISVQTYIKKLQKLK